MKRFVMLSAIVATFALPVQADWVVPVPTTTLVPYTAGTEATRSIPFLAWYEDLSAVGYMEQEYLVSGTGNIYGYTDDINESPVVAPTGVTHPYVSRMIVRHPIDPADFNGIVYFEILNASANYDGSPTWDFAHKSIIDYGAAYVGVTYSDVTAGFLRDQWGIGGKPEGAEPRNNARYATLSIPDRGLMWDILSQSAAALRGTAAPNNPMAGFDIDAIITTGYSQSARFVTTYANSFYGQVLVEGGDPIIDGYIIAAGTATASHPDAIERVNLPDQRVFHMAPAKAVRFTTESDLAAVKVRESQLDNPWLRTYEIAGASHVAKDGLIVGDKVGEYHLGLPDTGGTIPYNCDLPINTMSTGAPLGASMYRLARWITEGEIPPDDHLIDVSGDIPSGSYAWVRDADGNTVGGVRPAMIEVPLGNHLGWNPYTGETKTYEGRLANILCGIYGGFDEFDSTELTARYSTPYTWYVWHWWNLFAHWKDGFLLPVDAQEQYDASASVTW